MHRPRPWLLALVIAASPVPGTTAAADSISVEPEDCPTGSAGVTSHCGAECAPLPCKVDGDCRDKKVCRPTKLCIEKGERPGCGRVPDQIKYPYQVVHGECPSGGKCGKGTCEEARRCVPPPLLSCEGCHVGGASGAWLFPLLGLALLLLRRRSPAGRPAREDDR